MIELAVRGRPVVGVATSQFDRFSRQVLQQRGAGDLPLVTVAHPLGGIPSNEARSRVTLEVVDAVAGALRGAPGVAARRADTHRVEPA
jgi:hypothetical protein